MEALYARDYPVIIAVVFFSAIMTLVGYLFSDVVYAWVDPRIRYNEAKVFRK